MFNSVVLSTDEVTSLEYVKSFNSDSVTCIVDNSANAYIWNSIKDFVTGTLVQMSASQDTSIVTIGGSNFFPQGIGDVNLHWKDDTGKVYSTILKNVLYLPQPPVDVLSVTAFSSQLNDDTGTWIKTSRFESTLSWNGENIYQNFSASCI